MEAITSNKVEFDQNLYSRQLGAFGYEAMGKLVKLRVYIQGLRGLGIEVAKNLILAGPKKVVIQDETPVQMRDLGSNFYVQETDVTNKISRAQASLRQLKDLNDYVEVLVHEGKITKAFLKEFDVVVFTDFYNKALLEEYNLFCRSQEKPIGFIYAGSLGLYGFTFVDFGSKFICFDTNGEEPRSSIVAGITSEEVGIVTTHEDKRHGFEDGDYVAFKEVKGMEEINEQTFQIKVISPFQFSIGDTSKFSKYLKDGIVEQVKVQKVLEFNSFKETLYSPLAKFTPSIDTPEFEKYNHPQFLHLTLQALLEFSAKHERLPEVNYEKEAEELSQLIVDINNSGKKNSDAQAQIEIDEKLLNVAKNVARFANTNLTIHTSFWGGIVAQEIVKFTGKFMPIQQWLHFENFECLPHGPVTRVLANSRYDDQIAVFGNEFQNKIMNQKFFLVGAGALGCEFLKLFALMGLGCGKQGNVTVTDDDYIEISNLNRQFLFRKENLGASKSQTAAKVVKTMNPQLNVEALKLRVCKETTDIFDDNFWMGLDAVTNAVDNVKARLYVDGQCVLYERPLFESGTLGTKCNSQVILPHHTQSYGESQDPEEEAIPLCTLKNFPYQIEHTIQWARDFFEGIFVDGPLQCNKYLKDPVEYVQKLQKELKQRPNLLRSRLQTIDKISKEFGQASHERCIVLARELFQEIFNNLVAQLLYNCPPDHKTEAGAPFWSGPRRLPKLLNFDTNDEASFAFVFAAANLFAHIFCLPKIEDRELVAKIATKHEPKEFNPKKAKISENQNSNDDNEIEDDYEAIDQLSTTLQSVAPFKEELNTIEFEKDDDTNFHIDFITATANLRARNYLITEVPRHKVKMIAGKIIPAIATTTAMVVGTVGFEILKLILDKKPEEFANSFTNLALPLFLFSTPMPPNKTENSDYDPFFLGPIRAFPSGFTVWDSETIQGPLTLKEIVEYYYQKYSVEVSSFTYDQVCLYNKHNKQDKSMPNRILMTPIELYEKITQSQYTKNAKYFVMEITGITKEGIYSLFPRLKYKTMSS